MVIGDPPSSISTRPVRTGVANATAGCLADASMSASISENGTAGLAASWIITWVASGRRVAPAAAIWSIQRGPPLTSFTPLKPRWRTEACLGVVHCVRCDDQLNLFDIVAIQEQFHAAQQGLATINFNQTAACFARQPWWGCGQYQNTVRRHKQLLVHLH